MSNFPDTPPGTYRVYPLNTFWSSRAAQAQSSSVVFTDPVALKYRAIKCLNSDIASNLCSKVLFRWFKMGLPSLFRSAFYWDTKCNLKENSINIPPSCSSQFVKCCLRLLIAPRKTSRPKPSLLRYTTKTKAKSFKRVWFKVYKRRIHPRLVPEIVSAKGYIKNISISCWNLFFRQFSIRQKSQLNILTKLFSKLFRAKIWCRHGGLRHLPKQ